MGYAIAKHSEQCPKSPQQGIHKPLAVRTTKVNISKELSGIYIVHLAASAHFVL